VVCDSNTGITQKSIECSPCVMFIQMKTRKCDLCDVTAEGETFEEWMQALRPHYGEAHADVMNDSSRTKEHMEQWMAENKARFEAA